MELKREYALIRLKNKRWNENDLEDIAERAKKLEAIYSLKINFPGAYKHDTGKTKKKVSIADIEEDNYSSDSNHEKVTDRVIEKQLLLEEIKAAEE